MLPTIDKQTFLAALGCATMAWFQQRDERDEITPGLDWQFFNGNQVGAAARQQLEPGLLLPRSPITTAVDATTRRVAEVSQQLLFEATFTDGALVARADAIRRSGDGWDLIEVKSSKEDEKGKIKQELIDDIGYTVMVARSAGLKVVRCTLMLMSRAYRLGTAGNPMVEIDVSELALAQADHFANVAPEIVECILADARPEPELKIACRSCDFFATDCLGAGITSSIFVLPALSAKKLEPMKPIVDVHLLPLDVDLTDNQRRVFEVIRSGTPQLLDGMQALSQLQWPAYYLDFETVMPALPWFDGDGAHTNHPFQFSVHRSDMLGQIDHHAEYLAPADGDWRRVLAEELLAALGTSGSIVVYTDFEGRVLKGLAESFPDLAAAFEAAIARLFDLHEVVKRGYIHPGFGGRTSIKKVLPVLAPGFGYQDLTIGEGQSASGVFGLMRVGQYQPDSFDAWRGHLLKYCKLDTIAMIKVHQALAQITAR